MQISIKRSVFLPKEVIQVWVHAERLDGGKQRIHLHFLPFEAGV